MRANLYLSPSLVLLGLLGISPGLRASDRIAPEQFTRLHALIKPEAAEQKWEEIPWMAGLWDARVRSAAEGKPILLWEMDGHPLGCV
jgi:hypothetical protein